MQTLQVVGGPPNCLGNQEHMLLAYPLRSDSPAPSGYLTVGEMHSSSLTQCLETFALPEPRGESGTRSDTIRLGTPSLTIS